MQNCITITVHEICIIGKTGHKISVHLMIKRMLLSLIRLSIYLICYIKTVFEFIDHKMYLNKNIKNTIMISIIKHF